MTLEQALALGGFVYMVISGAILIGLWRGRQEAADKAAAKAIENTEEKFSLRMKNLETQVGAQASLMEHRIKAVDRDINGVKESITDVKTRLTESESERREEFQRLHKIANDTHALIVQHLAKLQESYIPRSEYEARHEEVDRRVSRLEQQRP